MVPLSLVYGSRYGMLLLMDTLAFAWHGHRPDWWTRKFVKHHLSAPMVSCDMVPTEQDFQALRASKILYPDRVLYLALGSRYSPWHGNVFFHQVKVVVGSRDGSPPLRLTDGYGMPLERFKRLK